MTPAERLEQNLAEFGLRVLKAMEANKEWNSDLWAAMEQEATILGLARADRRGYFKAVLPKATKG